MKRFASALLFVFLAASAFSSFAAENKEDEYGWRTLFNGKDLDDWSVPVYGGDGPVTVKDGCIIIGQGAMITGIRYEKVFPRLDYEIRYEAKKTKGYDFFASLTFPYNDSFCTFINGGWGGATIGLSCIDDYNASENSTTAFYRFVEGVWYKFRVRVTGKAIQVWIEEETKDGKREEKLVIDLDTKDRKIALRNESSPYKPIGLCTYSSEGVIRDIEYRKLRPEEVNAKPE